MLHPVEMKRDVTTLNGTFSLMNLTTFYNKICVFVPKYMKWFVKDGKFSKNLLIYIFKQNLQLKIQVLVVKETKQFFDK